MGKKAKKEATNSPVVIAGEGKEAASDEATAAFLKTHADEVEILEVPAGKPGKAHTRHHTAEAPVSLSAVVTGEVLHHWP